MTSQRHARTPLDAQGDGGGLEGIQCGIRLAIAFSTSSPGNDVCIWPWLWLMRACSGWRDAWEITILGSRLHAEAGFMIRQLV